MTRDSEDDDDDDVSISKGDRVEAKLKGWTKYYKGKITRENRDGTYDILFDDGERKSKVDAKLIKSLERKRKRPRKRVVVDVTDDDNDSDDDEDDVSISKGDRVEAKLKGWTKYYKGKITRENRDGTYDILFDDGERKSKVDAKLIKSLERKSKKTKSSWSWSTLTVMTLMMMKTMSSISKGDRVEAKLKGWTKYYKGKITRENRDGTYDILFDDGERKSKVDAKLIKSLEKKKKKTRKRQGVAVTDDDNDSDDDDDDVSLSKGDRVEAKLKGWTKYYKGKITRENRDGTYDILFDDGERKSKVDAKLIKSLEKKKTKKKTRHSRDSDSDADDDERCLVIKGRSCRS